MFIETDCRDPYHKSYLVLIFPNSPYQWQEVCCVGEVLVQNLVSAVGLQSRLQQETGKNPDISCSSSNKLH